MNPWPFFIGADGLSLSTEWTTAALGVVDGDDTTEPLPTRGWLAGLDVRLSDVQDAGSVRFYLSKDEAGEELLTPSDTAGATQSINLALGSATSGGTSWNLARRPFAGGVVYIHLVLDAGTANASVRLSGECGSCWRVRP